MLLPIKNMSYLPIIRFKNRWQTFDLNLHYPYSVNGKIINYTHLGYRGDILLLEMLLMQYNIEEGEISFV